jgi:hypothetical protein
VEDVPLSCLNPDPAILIAAAIIELKTNVTNTTVELTDTPDSGRQDG